MAEVRTKEEPTVGLFIILSVLQASREIELYHKISADSFYSIVTLDSPKYALGTERREKTRREGTEDESGK